MREGWRVRRPGVACAVDHGVTARCAFVLILLLMRCRQLLYCRVTLEVFRQLRNATPHLCNAMLHHDTTHHATIGHAILLSCHATTYIKSVRGGGHLATRRHATPHLSHGNVTPRHDTPRIALHATPHLASGRYAMPRHTSVI